MTQRSTFSSPIFIVGTARSGTTLFAAMLGAHSRIACGPETAFFRFVHARADRAYLKPSGWPDEAVKFIASLRRERAGSILDAYDLSADEVRRELAGKPPSLRAMLEAIVVPYARRQEKPRWAEKTPAHLLDVRELRAAWPDAPVIRLVRDPRAVAASILKVPFPPHSVTGAAYLWMRQDEAAHSFFERDRRATTIRYEDLVADPDAAMKAACRFVGESFEPEMLERHNSDSLIASAEAWKWRVGTPIDASRASAWRDELPAVDQERVSVLCAPGILRHGYVDPGQPRAIVRVHAFGRQLKDLPELLEPIADGRYLPDEVRADGPLRSPLPDLIRESDGGRFPDGSGTRRAAGALRLLLRLAAARLSGRRIARIATATPVSPAALAVADRALARAVRMLTVSIDTRTLRDESAPFLGREISHAPRRAAMTRSNRSR